MNLTLSRSAQLSIVLGFLVVLPVGLLAGGVAIWWQRRKR
jgi:hypothetical protein